MTKKVASAMLLLHWGTSGGGTRFHRDVAVAAMRITRVAVSYNSSSDQAVVMSDLNVPSFVLRTYRTKVGVILGIPRLIVNLMRLRRFLQKEQIGWVVGTMESIYQSIAVPLTLPRTIRYSVIIHDAVQHPGDEHVLKRIGRRIELRRADEVITLSQTVARALCQSGQVDRRHLRTLFHPVYGEIAEKPRELPRGRAIVVGTFGRLLPYKGIDLFLDAVAVLASRGVVVDARVAGEGPEARLARTPNGGLATWRTGWIDDNEVEAVVRAFDIVVVTYREASQSGVVALALAAGIPVVATPVGGLREQVEGSGAGLVSSALSADAVADSIEALVSDEAAYRAMSARAITAAERLKWGRFAAELLRDPQ